MSLNSLNVDVSYLLLSILLAVYDVYTMVPVQRIVRV